MHVRRLLVAVVSLVALSASAKGRDSFDALSSVSTSQELSSAAQNASAKGALVEHFDARLGLPTFVSANPGRASSQGAQLRGRGPQPRVLGPRATSVSSRTSTGCSRPTSARATAKSVASFNGAVDRPVHAEDRRDRRLPQRAQGPDGPRPQPRRALGLPRAGRLERRGDRAHQSFTLGERDAAVAKAFTDLTGGALGASELVSLGAADGGYVRFDMNAGARAASGKILTQPARAKKVFFTLPSGYEPAYYVEVEAGAKDSKDADFYSYVVSAKDGHVLFRNNLTVADSYGYRVWARPRPRTSRTTARRATTPRRTRPASPTAYQAPFVAAEPDHAAERSVQPQRSVARAGRDPDHRQQRRRLRGPHRAGRLPGRRAPTCRADVTAPGMFDRTYDVTSRRSSSTEQQQAAVAHLFYLNNFLHDWFYDSGFDEAAGNAQLRNYGRGGVEGDSHPRRGAGLRRPQQREHVDARRRRSPAHADVRLRRRACGQRHRARPRSPAATTSAPAAFGAADLRPQRRREDPRPRPARPSRCDAAPGRLASRARSRSSIAARCSFVIKAKMRAGRGRGRRRSSRTTPPGAGAARHGRRRRDRHHPDGLGLARGRQRLDERGRRRTARRSRCTMKSRRTSIATARSTTASSPTSGVTTSRNRLIGNAQRPRQPPGPRRWARAGPTSSRC